MLLIFFGNIGTGKTSLAKLLAARKKYKLIYFDNIVKQMFVEIYDKDDNFLLSNDEIQMVYDRMHEEAKKFLNKGENVILESMYFQKQREQAIVMAKKMKMRYKIIEVTCREKVVRQRLIQRKKDEPQSPGFKLYKQYKGYLEPETNHHIIIDTSDKTLEESYIELIKQLKISI